MILKILYCDHLHLISNNEIVSQDSWQLVSELVNTAVLFCFFKKLRTTTSLSAKREMAQKCAWCYFACQPSDFGGDVDPPSGGYSLNRKTFSFVELYFVLGSSNDQNTDYIFGKKNIFFCFSFYFFLLLRWWRWGGVLVILPLVVAAVVAVIAT